MIASVVKDYVHPRFETKHVTKKMQYTTYFLVACLNFIATFVVVAANTPWPLEQRYPFNAKLQTSKPVTFHPLSHVQKTWNLCVLVPHLKDAYWIGIDYGLATHAKQLGVSLELFEAGGYYGKAQQLEQLSHCMSAPFDAILLGSVDPLLLNSYQGQISKPIIALVNRIDSPLISTRVGVNWYQMGWVAGHYIQQAVLRQSTKTPPQLALLTGPERVGGSAWVEQGVLAALEHSTVTISSIRHADNNRDLYRDQLHHLLNDHIPDYILGSAVAVEAAVGELQHRGLDSVQLVSSYLSPATLRGLYRNRVAFSSDDQVVLQGKLAIDITVRELQGAAAYGDIGPKILGLKAGKKQLSNLNYSLAPADFYPIYRIDHLAKD